MVAVSLKKQHETLTTAIVIFNTKPVKSSRRWGSSWGQFYPSFEPSTTFTFYTNASGSKTLKVLSEGGTELNEISVDAEKGFNYAKYDLSITDAGMKALMKEDTSIKINKAQNGKYYLPKGTYSIKIGNESTSFEVK